MKNLNSKGKLRKVGILTGANCNRKKLIRKEKPLVKGASLLANGMLDRSARCKENSPYAPHVQLNHRIEAGTALVFGLLARFKVS